MQLNLLPYQQKAYEFILSNNNVGLFLDMGLGKTATVLKAIQYYMTETPDFRKALIIGPKRVVETTWPDEIKKWDCFCSTPYSLISGTASERAQAALNDESLHLISRDNLTWLVEHLDGTWDYDLLVIDELSSFKNPSSQRFKCLKPIAPRIKKVIGMTGTPAPNGMMDLWSQVYLLDFGLSLGRNITAFRNNYFMRKPTPFPAYDQRPGAEDEILNKIKPFCLSMAQRDYLQLPELTEHEIVVPLKPEIKEQYRKLQKDMIIDQDGKQIVALTAGVLAGKLLQFCGGFLYDSEQEVHPVSQAKLEAMDQLVEEANGKPVLVYYAYKAEFEMLKQRYPQAVDIKAAGAISDWNDGKIQILLAHPASAGHGLNLQHGGSTVIWYNLTYDLELYMQANKRLHRMGQKQTVSIYHLTTGLLDSTILNKVLKGKAQLQNIVMEELKHV
jgi:SNF2 family DNA or RNA helicase